MQKKKSIFLTSLKKPSKLRRKMKIKSEKRKKESTVSSVDVLKTT